MSSTKDTSDPQHHLFVYGTLAPGRANEHVLKPIKGSWQSATVRGTLYEEGWGAAMGYPGIILDSKGSEVGGFVFTSLDLPDHWNRLDAFEGEGYRRVIVHAQTEEGETVSAYVYELSSPQP